MADLLGDLWHKDVSSKTTARQTSALYALRTCWLMRMMAMSSRDERERKLASMAEMGVSREPHPSVISCSFQCSSSRSTHSA